STSATSTPVPTPTSTPIPWNLNDHVCILTEEEDIEARKSSMDEFREGKRRVLLCSDLAARGLDVPNISVVIQVSSYILKIETTSFLVTRESCLNISASMRMHMKVAHILTYIHTDNSHLSFLSSCLCQRTPWSICIEQGALVVWIDRVWCIH
ncbi:hypothetical protein EON65_43240, partial [archaeon]